MYSALLTGPPLVICPLIIRFCIINSLRTPLQPLENFWNGHQGWAKKSAPGWFHHEIYSLLSEFRTGVCICILDGFNHPLEITADFVYLRMHGPGGKYQGRYSTQQQQMWH